MFCPNCGQQISDDSRFCEHCGSSVEQKEVTDPLYAPASHVPGKAPKKFPRPLKKVKMIIIAAILVAVVAIGIWFIKDWIRGGESVSNATNQELVYSESDNQMLPQQEQQSTQNEAYESDIDGMDDANDEDITSLSSTYDRPTMDDFGWYEDVFQNGVWSEAKPVTELPYMLGGWKCYIVYDPYRNMDSHACELANVDIATTQAGISLTVDWYQMYWEGEASHDESSVEDSVFTGTYENEEFYLTGPGNIILGNFYEYEGNYYGLGSLLTPDGITADFCLMR